MVRGAVVTRDVPDEALSSACPRGCRPAGAQMITVGVIGYGYWGPISSATSCSCRTPASPGDRPAARTPGADPFAGSVDERRNGSQRNHKDPSVDPS